MIQKLVNYIYCGCKDIPVAKKRNVTDSRSRGSKEQHKCVSFLSMSGETRVKISSNDTLSSV